MSVIRRGETTYTCSSCKKLTRNTGDEGNCRLCAECFELSGIENHLSDNGSESMNEVYGDVVKGIFSRRPELVAHFSDLAAALPTPAPVAAEPIKWTKTADGYTGGESFLITKENARKFLLWIAPNGPDKGLSTARCVGSLAECKATAEDIARAVKEAKDREAAEAAVVVPPAPEVVPPTPEPAPVEPVTVVPPTPEKETEEMAATKTPAAPAAKTPAAKKSGNTLGSAMVKVLKVLKAKPMTRAEISAKTGINSGFTSLLGHLDPAKREPQSLSARGLIKPTKEDQDGKDVIKWSLTAAGSKALEAAK